ncbi:MAG: methyltransferase domain-containing protein [Alphaproteobacteria bacterium]|nr:methyltransferase domain-containing protein [Alphaproteobacteria bacterium]
MSARALGDAMAERAARRGLRLDLARLERADAWLFGGVPAPIERALFVGVGHGHDALWGLMEGRFESVLGVDPYVGAHGNDDRDFQALQSLIADAKLTQRFAVERTTVEDYLGRNPDARFDAIICNDVLHHIFETAAPLSRSELAARAGVLFGSMRRAAPNGWLVVSEVERHGLRPVMTRCGLLGGDVNYATKQPREEWDAAIRAAGWTRLAAENYIPYALRTSAPLWSGTLGRYTVCDRYRLIYRAGRNTRS